MMDRRSALAAGGAGILTLTAGCLDFVLGNAPLEYTAEPLLPSEAALEESGYREHDRGWEGVTEEIAGREVRAAGWTVVYTNEITIQDQSEDGAIFAGVTMPRAEIAGYSLNPLADMETEELIAEFSGELEGEFDGFTTPEPTGESFQLQILGADRTVEIFESEADVAGERHTIELYITRFDHRDDTVILLGGYPQQLPDEGVEIERLMESVEHPASADVGSAESAFGGD